MSKSVDILSEYEIEIIGYETSYLVFTGWVITKFGLTDEYFQLKEKYIVPSFETNVWIKSGEKRSHSLECRYNNEAKSLDVKYFDRAEALDRQMHGT